MSKINSSVLMSGAEYFSDQFAINAHMDSRVPVDVNKAIAEHNSIKQALYSAGVNVVQVPAPKGLQDGVYTANWALCRGDKALMSVLPNKRAGEMPYAEKILRELGKEIIHLPENLDVQASSSLGFSRRGMEQAVSKYSDVNPASEKRTGAEEVSRVDGSADKQAGRRGLLRFSGQGDALPCGNRVFVGSNYRTSIEAWPHIQKLLGFEVVGLQTIPKRTMFGYGKRVINKETGWPDSYYYDLDLALAVLREDLIAYCPEVFVPSSRKILEKLPINKIKVSRKEATKGFACNLVSTGETVVMSAHAPKLKKQIEARGLKTITPEVTELGKGGGYIRCTTLTLDNS